ncbi:hypothetical protein [Pseudomonas putida]|uniref:Uncharacterized protein n=1 Tax=Pseudomonas putida TaxID=303 RepID=A0A8I1EGE5_PSEPU|nr:hypothetical protein [Pseudomonas putida]MBI6885166.1 hypothetical protein [Pseudomonas putida]
MKQLSKKQMSVLLRDTLVKDADGAPMMVFRGEHGKTDGASTSIRTLLGSISFGSQDAASNYAESPNQRGLSAESPTVYPAYLIIKNPFIHGLDDPFIDFSFLENRLGTEIAVECFLKNAGMVENTNNWQEEINGNDEWTGLRDFYNTHPERMGELYTELFPMLDDPEFIRVLKAKGYDGAIYGGSGHNALEREYRVFDESSVIYALSREITPKRSLKKAHDEVALTA